MILSIFATIELTCRMKRKCFSALSCRPIRSCATFLWWCFLLIRSSEVSSVVAQSPEGAELRLPVGCDRIFEAGHSVRFMPELVAPRAGKSGVVRLEVVSECGDPVVGFRAAYAFKRDSMCGDGAFRSRSVFTLPPLSPGCYRVVLSVDDEVRECFRLSCEPRRISSEGKRRRRFVCTKEN